MAIYIVSIFLSAFLIFQVQPLVGKLILPWFGGTSAVWSAVLLFFQVLLTGGYTYAFWLLGLKHVRKQAQMHISLIASALLLAAALAFIWPSPITPGASLAVAEPRHPVWEIFKVLGASVGLPYFVLAANSTLVQAWFGKSNPGRSPYWLYAVSNGGSLLALLSYPLLIEPAAPLQLQGWGWSLGFVLYVIVTLVLISRLGVQSKTAAPIKSPKPEPQTPGRQLLWVLLSAAASVLLLATTSQLTQEVAPIPFLWVLPLAVYLLSFVIAFSGRGYYRPLFSLLLAASSLGIVWINAAAGINFFLQIGVYIMFLFSACMVAHGELYQLRPAAGELSRFYLLVSAGGALGGAIVNLLAPVVFSGYWEFYIGWAGLLLLLTVLLRIRRTEGLPPRWRLAHDLFVGLQAVLVLAYAVSAVAYLSGDYRYQARNFYGVSRVYHDTENGTYRFIHGSTVHGVQFIDPNTRLTPTTYFWEGSGIARIIQAHPRYGNEMHVGVLGLGVGTLAAYAQPGDSYRFYEINPDVIALAEGQDGFFSFLQNSPAEITIIAGDARIQLEQELTRGEIQQFDLLVMDAFSSDSVPVHLLTQEAFALYLQHLASGGCIAVNITNRYLDLKPVVWLASQEFRLHTALFVSPVPEVNQAALYSEWMLLARDPAILDSPEIAAAADFMEGFSTPVRLWTDNYSNLLQLLVR